MMATATDNQHTELFHHNRIVFEEICLGEHLHGIQALILFIPHLMQNISKENISLEHAYIKKYSTLQQETQKIGFQTSSQQKSAHICFLYIYIFIYLIMLSSSLYAFIKLSKMTSPQKLFVYDCLTLYINQWFQLSRHRRLVGYGVHKIDIKSETRTALFRVVNIPDFTIIHKIIEYIWEIFLTLPLVTV